MAKNGTRKATGLNLFLALSKLDLLLAYGERATPQPDDVMTAGISLAYMAFVSDFRTLAGEGFPSELFTLKAVGELVVKMGVEEGVIIECGAQGLGVRLQHELSPAFAQMLHSLNGCLGSVLSHYALSNVGGRPAGALRARLGARNAGVTTAAL